MTVRWTVKTRAGPSRSENLDSPPQTASILSITHDNRSFSGDLRSPLRDTIDFTLLRRGELCSPVFSNTYRRIKSLYVILSAGRRVRPPTEVELPRVEPRRTSGSARLLADAGSRLKSRWLAIGMLHSLQKATKTRYEIPAALWRLAFSSLFAQKKFDWRSG